MTKNTLRVVMLGNGGVGKSCLTIAYTAGRFVEEYDPTLEDSYKKQININGKDYSIEIYDTAGQDDYANLRDGYYRTGDGFICVYSICSRSSFEDLRDFHKDILRCKHLSSSNPQQQLALVVVGNKSDLEDERIISTEEGMELAEELGAKFVETSAKAKHLVDDMFRLAVEQVLRLVEEQQRGEKQKENGDWRNEKEMASSACLSSSLASSEKKLGTRKKHKKRKRGDGMKRAGCALC
ncbi:RAS1 protein [Balamuthia mandrillaris]